jgi:aspartate aminotransferase
VGTGTTLSSARLARRLEAVGFSDIVQVRNLVMALREQGERVFQFEGGEPFFPTPQPVKDAMMRALAADQTRYAPSSGVMELRQALVEKINRRNRIAAVVDDVIVTNGGMQGLYGAFQSILDPDDELLLFAPYWTPIRDLVLGCQAKPVPVSLPEARRKGLKLELERHLTRKTRALYYNSPMNPSGAVLTRAEAEMVAGFVREHDLVVIADEAYEDLVYDGEHVSLASLPGMYERTISVFTFSKSYSMTGWRAGYTVCGEPWMTGLRKLTLYATNGVATPTQFAALAALALPHAFLDEMRAEYRKRRDLFVGGLNQLGLTCDTPAGAFYAFPDASRIDPDSRKSADLMLRRAKVAGVPGIVFGEQGEGHLRMSFSTSIETIEEGLASLRRNL